MTFTKKNLLAPALLSIALLGCAAKPTHVVIAPVMQSENSVDYKNVEAQLKVTDLRTNQNIVQVLREGEAAELYPSLESLTDIVNKALTDEYAKNGLVISKAPNRIAVTIDSAKIVVEQGAVSYTAKTEIIIRASTDNNDFQVSKKFKATATNEGALTADIAKLESDFSMQLGKVLSQIVHSNELKDVLY